MSHSPALLLPYLQISSPDGNTKRLVLTESRYTIGRLPDYNDIPLPEEEGIITRIEHCILEKEAEGWAIIDRSTNGTILAREGQKIQLAEQGDRKAFLSSGDVIEIHHWRLQFIDPNRTREVVGIPRLPNPPSRGWVFNISQKTLFQIENGSRTSVRLRPQVRQMIEYMAERNLANGNTPVLCSKDEISLEIWQEKGRNQDLDKLALEIRKILNRQPSAESAEQWLETVVGAGYILRIDSER